MAKKTRTENWRVVVVPDLWLLRTDDEKRGRCRELIKEIQRHVDGLVSVDYDADDVVYCPLCNNLWEAEDDGTPMCCDAAIDEHVKALGGQK